MWIIFTVYIERKMVWCINKSQITFNVAIKLQLDNKHWLSTMYMCCVYTILTIKWVDVYAFTEMLPIYINKWQENFRKLKFPKKLLSGFIKPSFMYETVLRMVNGKRKTHTLTPTHRRKSQWARRDRRNEEERQRESWWVAEYFKPIAVKLYVVLLCRVLLVFVAVAREKK